MLAKFTRPRPHKPIKRTRLFKLLDQRKRHPIVWVCGPPGSGKTTLVASYLDQRGGKALWFHVDEGDRDPATFFAYLREACAGPSVRKQASLPAFSADYLLDLTGFSRRFFRELYRQLGRDAVLVLDNCHSAATGAIETILAQAATELPPGTRLFLLSRTESPAALAREKLNDRVLDLGWDELRLTLEESKALAESRGAALDSVSELHQRTDGWVAGMVALMNTVDTRRSVAERKTQRDLLFDYFAHEIFEPANAAQRKVLLYTSLFQRFTVPMAAAVSGESAIEELLEALYRRHSFVERSTGVYQYHDLFRDFLHARLLAIDAPELRAARSCAAQVLEQQNSIDAAVELQLDANEFAAAARLIRTIAPMMVEQGRHAQLGAWLIRLPESSLEADPWLRYWLGVGQLQSSFEQAQVSLTRALGRFEQAGDIEGEIFAIDGLCLAVQANWDYRLLPGLVDALAERLPRISEDLSRYVQYRAWCTFLNYALEGKPGHPLIRPAYAWLHERLFDGSLTDSQCLEAAFALVGFHHLSSELEGANALVEMGDPLFRQESTAPLVRLAWCTGVGSYLGHNCQLERAVELLSEGVRLGDAFGAPGLSYMPRMMRAYCYWWSNEPQRTAADIETLSQIAAAAGIPKTVFEYKARALLASQQGRIAEAMALAELTVAAADSNSPAYMPSFARADMAPIAIQAGQPDKAERWISEGEAIDRSTIVRINAAQYEAVRATLAYERGDRVAALKYLREALRIARNPDVRGELCASRPFLPPLFGEALNEGIEIELVIELIKLWRISPPSFHVERWPWPIRIHVLGEFRVLVDDKPRAPARRAPVKVLELLKALAVMGPAAVSAETLGELLWPDSEGDAGASNLRANVLRLRQLLGSDAAVTVQDNKIALNPVLCWVDAWVFERLSAPAVGNVTVVNLTAAVKLYRGHLLAQESYAWLVRSREKYKRRFAATVKTLVQELDKSGSVADAQRLREAAREIDLD